MVDGTDVLALRGRALRQWRRDRAMIFQQFTLGPLTGSPAIGITDLGSLGKLFSEALETIDMKQVEGVIPPVRAGSSSIASA